MARDCPFDFSFPGELRFCAFDPLSLFLAATFAGRSSVSVHRRLDSDAWESIGTQLQGHSGPVRKVAWAHPDHGPLFASCSEDTTIKVWELNREPDKAREAWRMQTTLTPHREKATDLQFLDDGQSLVLACCTVAGEVVVYECENRAGVQWKVIGRFETGDLCAALSWGPSTDNRQIAVADTKAGRSRIRIWQCGSGSWSVLTVSEDRPMVVTSLAWSRPIGRKFCFLAVGFAGGQLDIYAFQAEEIRLDEETKSVIREDETDVARTEWDQLGTYLSVSWESGHCDVFKRTLARTWKSVSNR